jgi:hypothetical protein
MGRETVCAAGVIRADSAMLPILVLRTGRPVSLDGAPPGRKRLVCGGRCRPQCRVTVVRTSSIDPDRSPGPAVDTAALLSALRLAGWLGVAMTLQDSDGNHYRLRPPIIIGDDFVQFATGVEFERIRISFDSIAAFELP